MHGHLRLPMRVKHAAQENTHTEQFKFRDCSKHLKFIWSKGSSSELSSMQIPGFTSPPALNSERVVGVGVGRVLCTQMLSKCSYTPPAKTNLAACLQAAMENSAHVAALGFSLLRVRRATSEPGPEELFVSVAELNCVQTVSCRASTAKTRRCGVLTHLAHWVQRSAPASNRWARRRCPPHARTRWG